ncbi:MAG: hypothetical protein Q8M20_07745 [Rhodocyclaceae bacterium]|nr:hypothetical protein [Rhodocyclaceae bacterium]MDZ4216364.1 hypothetical protein [Rhodocyclaceae bacterium]
MLGIESVNFDADERDVKGANTEDAGLKILANVAKASRRQIKVVERVAPGNVGEFDAICCTDSGIYFIEMKRLGGKFGEFSMLDRQIRLSAGRQEKVIPNPALKFKHKVDRLIAEEFNTSENWKVVKRLFSGHVPVHSILCFGPSTSFEEGIPVSEKNITICTTRTLGKTLKDIHSEREQVFGVGSQMAALVEFWPRWGILTMTGKRGFFRCSISKIGQGRSDATVWGLTALESDGARLKYTYGKDRKRTTAFDELVLLRAYHDGSERAIGIEPGTRFRWRIMGR